MSQPEPSTAPSPRLSGFDATMLVMGGIVGVGIFFTPHKVAALVPHGGWQLFLWALGAGVALCGAATFAELGGTFPRAGGWFEFLREIFGPFAAFLFAWVILGVVSTGAIAVIAGIGARFLGPVLPGGMFAGLEAQLGMAAFTIVAITGLALAGVRVSVSFQNLCMLTKLVAIAGLVVAGLVYVADPQVSASTTRAASEAAPPLWRGLVAASLPVLFSYGGWQMLCYVAPEVREPERVLPRAIVLGVAGVGLVYLAANAAFLRALGSEGLATTNAFAAEVAQRGFGERAGTALTAAMGVSALGIATVNILATPSIYVAMAKHGLFFRGFARLHSRTGAPTLALCAQLALALTYLGVGHPAVGLLDLDTLTGSVVFAEWFFHALTAYGLIRLRRTRPELPRPYTSFAFPLLPGLYLLVALSVIVGNLYVSSRGAEGARTVGLGLGVMLLGALVYAPWRALVARGTD